MSIEIEITDNTDKINALIHSTYLKALEQVGKQAEKHAKENCTAVDTGRLRNSITHKVVASELACYIGTNVKYGKYVEFGTGIYGENKIGGYWVYVDGNSTGTGKGKRYDLATAKKIVAMLRSKGLPAMYTNGMKPLHFLKRAATEHESEYNKIIKRYMSDA